MAGVRWTPEDDELLKKSWPECKKEELVGLFPDRTWPSLILRASIVLKIKRSLININVSGTKKDSYINGDSLLNKLLEETPEAYYWAGFIAADGSINHVSKRLAIGLAIKDKRHLKKFCKFINARGPKLNLNREHPNCRVAVQDRVIIKQFADKFNFKPRKTYDPPIDLKTEDDNLFLSFLIGYIDGDGSIGYQSGRKDTFLRIKCHHMWKDVLEIWFNRVYCLAEIENLNVIHGNKVNIKINKQGYAEMCIGNQKLLAYLKRNIMRLKLPVLNRKWKKVPLKYSNRYLNGKNNRLSVLSLYKSGYRVIDISLKLNLSYASVFSIIYRDRKGLET